MELQSVFFWKQNNSRKTEFAIQSCRKYHSLHNSLFWCFDEIKNVRTLHACSFLYSVATKAIQHGWPHTQNFETCALHIVSRRFCKIVAIFDCISRRTMIKKSFNRNTDFKATITNLALNFNSPNVAVVPILNKKMTKIRKCITNVVTSSTNFKPCERAFNNTVTVNLTYSFLRLLSSFSLLQNQQKIHGKIFPSSKRKKKKEKKDQSPHLLCSIHSTKMQ